jgi:homoserine dehydrogenase
MYRHPITVLKFGSSVLRDEADLAKAVQEIYRWVRTGQRVVAVVSAIGSTTDALLSRAQSFGSGLNDEAVATLVATGEATSSALLALALERAGLHSVIADEVRLGLKTKGPVLNAEPCTVDAGKVYGLLEKASVAVVPGFLGRQQDGTISLLGRGGSDLTAAFLAHQLKAERCRLIKDVDGIFECDPADAKRNPRRFKTVTWDEVLAIGGGIVQPRAIEFAQRVQLNIEVASLNSEAPTCICAGAASFCKESVNEKRLRVGLLGAGTVGLGVYRNLVVHPEMFEVVRVGVRHLEREDGIPRALLMQNPWEVIGSECDLVIELIGGVSPAKELIEAALESGKHVITANKLVISRYGKHLRAAAEEAGVKLLYSAAVGGAVPMLENVARIARATGIRTLQGVINGTTNYILDRLAEGLTAREALLEAQRLGFAEQDPTSDLDGSDAAHKLALLAQTAFGTWLSLADVERIGIEQLDSAGVEAAARSGHAVRLVATLSHDGRQVRARVAPQLVANDHPFAQTHSENNCLAIESRVGEITHVRGKGAGRWPTAVSVMADLCDIHRRGQFGSPVFQFATAAGRAS